MTRVNKSNHSCDSSIHYLEVWPQQALLRLDRFRVGHDVDGQRGRPAVVVEQLDVGHAEEHGGVVEGRRCMGENE